MSLFGNMAAPGHSAAQDEILKNSLANFAFENYEIASHKSLIQLAEESGNEAALDPACLPGGYNGPGSSLLDPRHDRAPLRGKPRGPWPSEAMLA